MKGTVAQKKKKLWKVFSKYIRLRDKNICFTCGMKGDATNAGHFHHNAPLTLYFDLRNVHCQCIRCNLYLSGNLAVYAVRLEKKYGFGILQDLELLKHTIVKDFPFEELFDFYTEEIVKLSA